MEGKVMNNEHKLICPKCGFENLEEAVFCIKCGHRIDGKVPCPKCGEYISNDADKCPHCGKEIPHKKEAVERHNQIITSKREKAASIFNRVSVYVSLFVFILFIAVSFGPLFDYHAADITPEYIRIILAFTNFDQYTNIVKSLWICRATILFLDFVATLMFGIVGIIKTSKAIKNRSITRDIYKYIAVLLTAKLVTLVLYKATLEPNEFYLTTFAGLKSIIALTIIHLSVCLGFDCFLHFKKGQVSIFIARIILAVSLYLPLLIIVSFGEPHFFSAGQPYGFIYHFIRMCNLVSVQNGTPGFISSYVFSCLNVTTALFLLTLTYSLIVFFVSSYFHGMNKFKRFRIVFYMLVISLSILSSGYLITSYVEISLFNSFLNGSEVEISSTSITVFIYTVLLVGVAIATFNIYNRANRRAALAAKTTVK